MSSKYRLLEALNKFKAQKDKCHHELSKEINISELKIKQLHYLNVIDKHRHLTFSRFAQILGITKPSVTNIVNHLIELDCVRKRQCKNDGRIYYVELSEKGKKIVEFQNIEMERLATKIEQTLSEEDVDDFVRIVDKIVDSE